jgi:hypothetical protein
MKMMTLKGLAGVVLAGGILMGTAPFEADAAGVSEVTRKVDGMFVVMNGKAEPMTEEVNLSQSITVKTNTFFTVGGGKPRELKLGQRLLADGMLIHPDGKIEPVEDHLAMQRGQLILVKDGESQPVDRPITLPDGTRISPDGRVQTRAGTVRRVIDGQLMTLSGGTIASKDTITLLSGKVVVQKDGSQMEVEPDRSFMMNDGTKVLGDGTVIKRDGSKSKLTEGQIIVIEGVVKRR